VARDEAERQAELKRYSGVYTGQKEEVEQVRQSESGMEEATEVA